MGTVYETDIKYIPSYVERMDLLKKGVKPVFELKSEADKIKRLEALNIIGSREAKIFDVFEFLSDNDAKKLWTIEIIVQESNSFRCIISRQFFNIKVLTKEFIEDLLKNCQEYNSVLNGKEFIILLSTNDVETSLWGNSKLFIGGKYRLNGEERGEWVMDEDYAKYFKEKYSAESLEADTIQCEVCKTHEHFGKVLIFNNRRICCNCIDKIINSALEKKHYKARKGQRIKIYVRPWHCCIENIICDTVFTEEELIALYKRQNFYGTEPIEHVVFVCTDRDDYIIWEAKIKIPE